MKDACLEKFYLCLMINGCLMAKVVPNDDKLVPYSDRLVLNNVRQVPNIDELMPNNDEQVSNDKIQCLIMMNLSLIIRKQI